MTESPSFQLVDAMRALQAALDHHDSAVSESQDLGRSDWRCLQALVNKGPLSPSVLQKRLGLTSGSVTALLDRLERRGLIERHRDPADRRGLRIVPTQAAGRMVEAASDPLESVTSKLLERWGSDRSKAAGQACLDLAKLVEWSARRV
ncbi:MAG: MarR family transcriptional regulator [Pseudomonadota bacterium]